MNPIGFLFIAFGVFAVLGAASDWDWFMGHRKERFVTDIVGRGGARVFYGFIGWAWGVVPRWINQDTP